MPPRFWIFLKCLVFYLLNSKKFDLVIVRTFSAHSLALGIFKRVRRPAFLSIILTDSVTEVPAVQKSVLAPVFRYLFSGNDFINAISPEVNAQLLKFRIDPEKIKNIPNLLENLVTADSVVVNHPSRQFIYVGNLAREKGVFELVTSFARALVALPDISLDIVGLGIDGEELVQVVRDLGIKERVKFHGTIPNEEISSILATADCLIYPSRKEGFGLVPFEAAVLPLKIIATRVGVLEYYLADRCEFVEINDELGLASAIIKAAGSSNTKLFFNNRSWKLDLAPENVVAQFAAVLGRGLISRI
jgi:glycosyltransferase involved in cell wall biosynthesis